MTPEQQAKHDEVMGLADDYAKERADYESLTVRTYKESRDVLSTAIAQLCAKPNSAEQVNYASDEEAVMGAHNHTFNQEYLQAAPLNIAQQAPSKPLPPPELTWLYTHCRAIGMENKSVSGKWEHDICAFTIDLQSQLSQAQEENARLNEVIMGLQDQIINLRGMLP